MGVMRLADANLEFPAESACRLLNKRIEHGDALAHVAIVNNWNLLGSL